MTITFELNLRTVLRWLLAALFIWAALSKLSNLQYFYTSLVAYQLPIPGLVLRGVATTLPWLELFCGLMLLTRFWLRPALLWSLLLCVAFAAATGQAWARGLSISCGCLNLDFLGLSGGSKSPVVLFIESVGFAFIRSLLLAAAAVYLLRNERAGTSEQRVAAVNSPDYA